MTSTRLAGSSVSSVTRSSAAQLKPNSAATITIGVAV